MRAKQKKILVIAIVVIVLAVAGYFGYPLLMHKHKQSKPQQTLNPMLSTSTVQEKTVHNQLFFSGDIAPLNVYNVTSPIAGTMNNLGFHYGQRIRKGQFLVEINSNKSEKDYRQALTDYLKAKDTFNTSKTKFASQQSLYKDGLIPRNEFEGSRSQLENDQLAYRQAVYTLEHNIDKITDNQKQQQKLISSLINLSLGDKSVDNALSLQFSKLKLYAKRSGIALFPSKASGEESGSKVHQGSDVKSGAVLVAIGDLSGLSVAISVNEIDVNKIKPGQKVIVTGVAFPKTTLHGYVQSVDAQAKSDMSGSGLPVFSVKVIVPKLTKAQRDVIHVGMTAQVTLEIATPKQIMVPISAIKQTDHGSYVTVIRKGEKKTISVITGQTTLTKVAVTQGLQPGDRIVKTHRTA